MRKIWVILILVVVSSCREDDAPTPLPSIDEQYVLDITQIDSLIQANGWSDVDTTDLGVRYHIESVGAGPEIKLNDIVLYDFIVKKVDGEVLFTSIPEVAEENNLEFANPKRFTHTETGWAITDLIDNSRYTYGSHEAGLKEGLNIVTKSLNVGGKATILVPSRWAYGRVNLQLDGYSFLRNEPIVYEITIINAE